MGNHGLEPREVAYLAKVERDRAAGFDRRAEPAFALDAAGPIEGPVLDVGVGKGIFAIEVARRGFEVVGIDPDPEALSFAKALAEHAGVSGRLRLLLADAADLPFPDGAFGAVVSMNALHHLPDAGPVLRNLVRVVRPGGRVVLADLSGAGLDWVGRRHLEDHGVPHPVGPVTVELAAKGLVALGLHAVATVRSGWEEVAVLVRPVTTTPSR